jgi:hypothetical protein
LNTRLWTFPGARSNIGHQSVNPFGAAMTIPIKGHSHGPAPLGLLRGGDGGTAHGPIGGLWDDGGWAPGPIGILWDKQPQPPPSGAVTKAAGKMTPMPLPANDKISKDVHIVLSPRFDPQKKIPSYTEVKQAENIANCPVAAILAAYAFTKDGRLIIQNMISETSGKVLTDLSGLPVGTLSNPPGATLASNRYFTVNLPGPVRVQLSDTDKLPGAVPVSGKPNTFDLPGGSIDVSDVLYTNDGDGDSWSLIYLRDPDGHTIWASIIEKALAVRLGSYENFDALNISANDFWNMITGAQPAVIAITPNTPLNIITDAAKASVNVPTIGASKETGAKSVAEFHGFAMLGFKEGKIRLYDAEKTKDREIALSPPAFRDDFQAILYRK